jgi:hypothetical protein
MGLAERGGRAEGVGDAGACEPKIEGKYFDQYTPQTGRQLDIQ